MLPVEDYRFCAVCGTVTPYSRQRLRPRLAAGLLLLLLAAASAALTMP
jgi:hypothetical protein